MKLTGLFLTLATVVSAASLPVSSRWGGDALTVNSTSGVVIGAYNQTLGGSVAHWLGVPFAKSARFEMSTRAPYATTSLNATKYGPSCWGIYGNGTSAYNQNPAELLDFQTNGNFGFSEDCLNLNIWAPRGAKNATVIIWLYGGSFYVNSNAVAYQLGWSMAQNQNIVFVAPNYRTNVFGYPSAAGINPSLRNVGLFDQRMAVEWARDNIADFGGNPDHMVLWAWAEDPIVKGLIGDSGSVFSVPDNSMNSSSGNFTALATLAGCNTSTPAVELECMTNIDAEHLDWLWANQSLGLSFNIIVDERTVFSSYKNRSIANIPYLMGSNNNEGATFTAYKASGVNQTGADIFMYKYLTCAMMEAAKYHYYGNKWMGAYHGSELPIVFGTYHLTNSTAEEKATSQYLQTAWATFAHDPVNGLKNYGWAQYNSSENTLNQIGLNNDATVHFTSPEEYDYICATYPAVNLG